MSQNPKPNLIVYTLEGCGKCVVFKKKLHSLGINYTEKNCSANPGVARVLQLATFPSIAIDEKIMGYNEAIEWLRAQDL